MIVKLGPRGQITIPKSVRQSLDIQPGDSVLLIQEGDEVRIRPIRKTIFDLVGALSLPEQMSFDEMRQKAKEHVARRVMEELDESREGVR